ncbi:MAG: bifunctional precorrin-2 dehydrogenase/sirohydrochlorin ferrochelatase [Chloroflexota bacterium]|nr:bifunctional precorrin-2 dehydrogenase/sirohydrochlorin ferrochelatase [Chloroflexota bacterium]
MARTDADRQYEYYPAFIDLVRKRVVVVGGGTIATQKVRGLLPCGAHPIVVVAPTVHDFITRQADAGRLEWMARSYVPGDLKDADLAFAATNDRLLNAQVAREARERAVPVLAVDDIPYCDFIAPAVVKRGQLTVAVSTSGRSPALASHTRRKLERVITPQWGELLEVAATVRDRLGSHKSQVAPETWQRALDHEVKRLIWAGDRTGAEELLWNRVAPEGVS